MHDQVREIAKRENISINQFISTAVAEKLSALLTEAYLQGRAARGSRRKFDGVLARVKDRPPHAGDELP